MNESRADGVHQLEHFVSNGNTKLDAVHFDGVLRPKGDIKPGDAVVFHVAVDLQKVAIGIVGGRRPFSLCLLISRFQRLAGVE